MVDLAALVFLSGRLPGLVLLLALGLAGCTGLVFQPMHQMVLTPDELGLAYREVNFTTADGVRLNGWFLPARAPRRGSVLFLHGNAENISTHIANVAWMPAAGVDVFLFDYRGYGRSGGEPSLDGLQLDFAAALRTLLGMPEADPERIVVFGQSLGAAVAITGLAASPDKDKVRALVVEGAFTSLRALAREKLAGFWLTWPLQWPLSLTIDDYRPIDVIGKLAPLPILIIQGEADHVVPAHHGIALFEAAGQPKQLWLLPGIGHIQAFTRVANRRRLRDYLDGILATAPRAPGARPAPRHDPQRQAPAAAAAALRPQSPGARARP
jgi:fermentation-respiration switch protein FrsA (DUF1100 family)